VPLDKNPRPEVACEVSHALVACHLYHRGLPHSQVDIHAAGWQHFLARLTRAATGDDPGPDPWLQDTATAP